jgi:hypothetical protein
MVQHNRCSSFYPSVHHKWPSPSHSHQSAAQYPFHSDHPLHHIVIQHDATPQPPPKLNSKAPQESMPVTVTTEWDLHSVHCFFLSPLCCASSHTAPKILAAVVAAERPARQQSGKGEVRFGSYATSQSLSFLHGNPPNMTRGPMEQYLGYIQLQVRSELDASSEERADLAAEIERGKRGEIQ